MRWWGRATRAHGAYTRVDLRANRDVQLEKRGSRSTWSDQPSQQQERMLCRELSPGAGSQRPLFPRHRYRLLAADAAVTGLPVGVLKSRLQSVTPVDLQLTARMLEGAQQHGRGSRTMNAPRPASPTGARDWSSARRHGSTLSALRRIREVLPITQVVQLSGKARLAIVAALHDMLGNTRKIETRKATHDGFP